MTLSQREFVVHFQIRRWIQRPQLCQQTFPIMHKGLCRIKFHLTVNGKIQLLACSIFPGLARESEWGTGWLQCWGRWGRPPTMMDVDCCSGWPSWLIYLQIYQGKTITTFWVHFIKSLSSFLMSLVISLVSISSSELSWSSMILRRFLIRSKSFTLCRVMWQSFASSSAAKRTSESESEDPSLKKSRFYINLGMVCSLIKVKF